jgi:two-component system OmpR family sensor kinase
MLAAFAVIGAVTVFALDKFLVGRLDQQLSVASTRYAGSGDGPHGGPRDNGDGADSDDGFGDARGQSVGTLGARVVKGQVTQFGIVGRRRTKTVPVAITKRLVALPVGRNTSVDLDPIGDYRMRATSTADGDLLIIGLPLRPIHETLAELLSDELAVFGAVLLITVVAGGWLIGLSLRPLLRVTATARQVSQSPLDADDPGLPHRVEALATNTEVGQLGTAFNHMLDHVEAGLQSRHETEQRLRQFIADASHELRTPVAAIRGHAESVRLRREPLPEAVLESMARIESEAKRMGVLVDDLLLLARLDAGRDLAHTEVDVSMLLIEAVNDARAAGKEHRWTLHLPDKPVTITGDDHRLRELVTNLLTNARVHTPAGTTVATALHVERASAIVTVTDDGPGIPEVTQPRVFERFYRGTGGRDPLTGSSGLGLAIVQAVATAHHGSVNLDSSPGHTEFTVRLPSAAQPPADSEITQSTR